VVGRLEAGEATRQFSDEEVALEKFKNPAGPKLMDRAQVLTDGSLVASARRNASCPASLRSSSSAKP
jgi:hypothetical protein